MQCGDWGRWSEFERMINRLGALCLADKRLAELLDAHPRDASDPLVAAFAEVLDAVCRFRDAPHDRSSREAWAALHRAYDTARVEDTTMPPAGGADRSLLIGPLEQARGRRRARSTVRPEPAGTEA
jgi:hypothetical protein